MGDLKRRADLALDEAEDVRDVAAALVAFMGEALADNDFTYAEALEACQRAERIYHESREALITTEWTGVGELLATACLTGKGSRHAERREREVRRRAAEIGMTLGELARHNQHWHWPASEHDETPSDQRVWSPPDESDWNHGHGNTEFHPT